MQRWLIAGLLTGCLSSLAFAVGNHPATGCGLGYMLWTNENHEKIALILGATTNHTSGNQTFGITSGTSGCNDDGAVKMVKAAEVYVDVNFESLRREMAVGHGEYVQAFAALIGASEATQPALLEFFRTEYASLFPSTHTTPEEMLQTLTLKLRNHPEFLS